MRHHWLGGFASPAPGRAPDRRAPPGQAPGKGWMVRAALPFIAWLRRRDERLGLRPA